MNMVKLTQTEKAYAAIKKAILQGEIEEGAFLSESEMMKRNGVGRTPYREACNRLHHEGLLEIVPRRGYLVPEVTYHSVHDLFEMRLILEGAGAELAALRADDKDIEELARLVNKPLPTKEFAAMIQANAEFHLRLARMTRNRELVELLNRNLEKTEHLMYIELRRSRFRYTELRVMHNRVVEALRARSPQQVREAVLNDILEAQRATLTFGKNAAIPQLGNGDYLSVWQLPADAHSQSSNRSNLSGGSRKDEKS